MKIIVLCGIKHSGKSTLGKSCKRNQCAFFDIDTVIEEIESMTVRNLQNPRKRCFYASRNKGDKGYFSQLQSKINSSYIYWRSICDNEAALETLQNTKPLMIFSMFQSNLFTHKNNALKTQSMPAYISDKNQKRR